jgi:L-lactate dehydrogenase complex protein LldG
VNRDAFLGRLRERLKAGIPENHVRPWIPLDGPPPAVRYAEPFGDLADRFVTRAQRVAATARWLPNEPEALAQFIRDAQAQSGATTAIVSDDAICDAARTTLSESGATLLDPTDPAAAARAALGVTGASFAIAATGSLVLETSRPDVRYSSLLPPVHVAIIRASQIIPSPGDLFRHLSARFPAGMPQSLTLVTGPSRSADIEMQLILGVHGPRALWIAVID